MQNSLSDTAIASTDIASTDIASSRDTAWRKVVPKYQEPNVRRAVTQAVTTLGLLAVALYVMNRSLAYPYWITLLLAVPRQDCSSERSSSCTTAPTAPSCRGDARMTRSVS